MAASQNQQRTIRTTAHHRISQLNDHLPSMPNTQTIHVPHLGGIDAAYQMPHPYDASKPTLCLVNSFTTSSELYQSQYANKQLTDAMNLISIELLGHGQTRTKATNWTYWDTAIMNLQVLEKLGMTGQGKKCFVLGTSQGGWITVRMALLGPHVVSTQIQNRTKQLAGERASKLISECRNDRSPASSP